jgi:hypothetical protein
MQPDQPPLQSIVFVAEYRGRTLLCAADAHSEILESSLDRLGAGRHHFTAVKLSHHGSKHVESLARVVTTQDRPVFYLNYVTQDVEDLISGVGDRYTVKVPRKGQGGTFREGITVRLG